MTLKLAVAAVLRTLRSGQRLTNESVNDATSRQYLTQLEHGKSNISLEKLQAISTALGMSPLTFIALALSVSSDGHPQALLESAQAELDEFEKSGGLEALQQQYHHGAVASRRPGRPVDQDRLMSVLRCKA
ncbi:MAG TPA: transcriptional regulator, partial [Pseudomonas sp.]|nr:transcriptional regulator [Pseudomonas sp.]